jgi:hypothetical protein
MESNIVLIDLFGFIFMAFIRMKLIIKTMSEPIIGLSILGRLIGLEMVETYQSQLTTNLVLSGFHGLKDWASDMTNGRSELAGNF